MLSPTLAAEPCRWGRFVGAFAAAAALVAVTLYGFAWFLDPYGSRAGPGRPPTALMDLNQRYMYPQVARAGGFDGAIFGTSTVRLIDPAAFGRAVAARVANLGLNAGTPWEQVELARLFLRHAPEPKVLLFGLDRTWCDGDADQSARRITFRSFPPWLYDEDPLNDLPGLLSLKSLELAGRLALHAAGIMPARIRGDGFEVFVPPDGSYDLARARLHIRGGSAVDGAPPPPMPEQAVQGGFPALAWLDDLLGSVRPTTRTLLVLPPIHVAAQAAPGTPAAARDTACKAEIAAIARRRGAGLADFRFPSTLTGDDANYWDSLHVRLPVAAHVAADLARILGREQTGPSSDYRLLVPLPEP